MDKIQRATEIHRRMTPHQMALRIVELEDALELAEEAVRAKEQAKQQAVPEGWQLVPVEPTIEMVQAATHSAVGFGTRAAYQAMLAAAPKPEGGAS